MEEKEITLGNKTISEFVDDGRIINAMSSNEEDQFLLNVRSHKNNGHFHKNWNWLMFVIEKIEGMLMEGSNIHIEHTNCYLDDYEHGISFSSNGETKIEAVFKVVCEYVMWYNENLKTLK